VLLVKIDIKCRLDLIIRSFHKNFSVARDMLYNKLARTEDPM